MSDESELPPRLRQLAQSYNEPPALTTQDLDAMWAEIGRETWDAEGLTSHVSRPTSRIPRLVSIAALAATLVIGVAIGRFSVRAPLSATATTMASASMADTLTVPEPYHSTTSRYLGQTAALLATLPVEVRAGRADERFVGRAQDLLLTTRLLLDSPAAADPRIRTLLDDLELVLAQIVRLQSDQGSGELDLIRQALEQRDVLPRLRTAVADISAD
jgi:hypothetical protein